MDALLLFLVPGLNGAAAKAALDCWFLGALFADWRARAQDARDNGRWAFTRLLGGALSCRFCLSYHVTFWLAILSLAALPTAWLVPAVWLAGQAVAHRLPAAAAPEVTDEQPAHEPRPPEPAPEADV